MIPSFAMDALEAQTPGDMDDLRAAVHEIGAFYLDVRTHVLAEFFFDLFEQASLFFRLPEPGKQSVSLASSSNFRGYVGLGTEYTNGVADLKESFEFAQEIPPPPSDDPPAYFRLYGYNQWPEESVLPGFRATLDAYSQLIHKIGKMLLSCLQSTVGQQVVTSCCAGSTPDEVCSFSRLIYYSSPAQYAKTVPRLQTHCDHVLFTTILQDLPGIEIRTNNGHWIEADPSPGSLLVFTGELIEFWSRGYYKAVPHRVHNAALQQERVSIASFFLPDLRNTVAPIDLRAAPHLVNSGLAVSPDNWWLTKRGEGHTDDGLHPVVVGVREWARMNTIFPEGTSPGSESEHGSL